MKVLLAEDDVVARCMLEAALAGWGYKVVVADDGDRAWQLLQAADAPRLVILDWVMPGLTGVEVCRRLRQQPQAQASYVLLLTSRDAPEDVVAGLDSGASDYLTKPCARVRRAAAPRPGAKPPGRATHGLIPQAREGPVFSRAASCNWLAPRRGRFRISL
jgi:DNA-binding response OmpR family regulator